MIKPLFPGGLEKCFTLSYDDGITQDIRLVEIFNKYKLKCTFNLNSGCFSRKDPANGFKKPVTHYKIDADMVKDLYKGHEVAVHTVTHPHLEYMSKEAVTYEIMEDRRALEALVGYPVRGMAFPFGTYSDDVCSVMKECGIRYSRTVEATKTFSLPADFLKWHPTAHFGDDNMEELLNKFLKEGPSYDHMGYLKVFYLWGHSYELDGNDTWDKMEEFCKAIAGKNDIWYATNIEIVDYVDAINNLIYSADNSMVENKSALTVWLYVDGQIIEIKPGEVKVLSE